MKSIIKPKRPKSSGWVMLGVPPAWVNLAYEGEIWQHESGLKVITAVEVVNDKNDIDKGPEYHVSISKNGGRCSSNEAKYVVDQFDMDGAEEDNHVPNGLVRNFWKPVAESLIGHECYCKDKENAFKENKGDYVWRGFESAK